MTSELLISQQIEEEFSELETSKTYHNFDDRLIKFPKSYANIQVQAIENSKKYNFQLKKLTSVSFKYKNKKNDKQLQKFDEDLIKHLKEQKQKAINKTNFNFFNTALRDFLKNNKTYDIFMVIKNKKIDCIKLDRFYTKVKSYDWEIMSETKWFKEKSNFQDLTNVDEFFQEARKSHTVELSIYSENKYNINENNDNNLKEVYLFLFDNPIQLQKFITDLKYSVYFSQQALANYFYNYICDLIFKFVLPSSDLLAFYKNIEIKKKQDNAINDTYISSDKSSSIFPLLEKVYNIEEDIILMMAGILKNQSKNSDHLVKIFLNNYEESNYSSDQFIVFVDENLKSLTSHCHEMKKELDIIFENSQKYEKFFFEEMKKSVEKYISFKGIFNIDIILTNDTGLKINKSADKFMKFLCFIPKCLVVDFFNKIFKCNEGFFHKHIQMFDFCYNFNERNIIHNFHFSGDVSQKNKIRIFDILFKDQWTSKITSIIAYILHFQSNFYKLNIPNDDGYEQYFFYLRNIIKNMRTNIFDIYDNIVKELFDDFPTFLNFCKGYYKFPLKKYNYIDNVCHHFSDYTVKTLFKNNYAKFSFDVINEMQIIISEREQSTLSPIKNYFPKLDTLYEESFILYDKELNNYLMRYFSLDKYLIQTFGTVDEFIMKLKDIDCEMNRVSTIELSLEEHNLSITLNNNIKNITILENLGIPEDEKKFPYAMYFNLYHFHMYQIMKEIYHLISNKCESKISEISVKIRQLNELKFLIKNMTYKFYLFANYIRSRLDKKKINYSTTIGHYVIKINSDNSKEQNLYEDIYVDLKNKINLFNN